MADEEDEEESSDDEEVKLVNFGKNFVCLYHNVFLVKFLVVENFQPDKHKKV